MRTSDSLEIPSQATPVVEPVRKGMWGEGPGDVSGFGGISRPIHTQPRASRPYGTWFDEIISGFLTCVPGLPEDVSTDRGELTLFVPKDKLLRVVQVARDDSVLRFESCTSVSGVHYPDDAGAELHIVYSLLSMTHNRRMRVEVAVSDEEPVLDSIVSVYPHVDWHEREVWDMFGVIFDGHPNLTRILMPDDWDGHPLRKDYPLGGIPLKFKGVEVPPPDERRSY